MRTISFACDFRAISKQRARTGKGFAFTPEKTKQFERSVARACNAQMEGLPIAGPCRMEIYALFTPPESWAKWRKEAAYGKPYVCASDADNMIKAIADGLNGVAYDDDKQVAHVAIERHFAKEDGFRVTLFELEAVPARRAA